MRHTFNLLLVLAVAANVNATDRVVSPSGTYNTISSAIAASSDGDRVLVSSGTYAGDVHIDKAIDVLPAAEGLKFDVEGYVRVSGSTVPRRVHVSGMRAWSLHTFGGTARLDLTLTDCFFFSVDGTSNDTEGKHHLELYRDSVTHGMAFRSGVVFGCVAGGVIATSGAAIYVTSGTTLSDPIRIIGNELPYTGGYSGNFSYSIDINTNTTFQIENNFVNVWGTNSKFVRVQGTLPFGQVCSITNNLFRRYLGTSSVATILGATPSNTVTVDIRNNATIGQTGTLVDWSNRLGTTTNNLAILDSDINTATGEALTGSPLIDAGDPDPRYLDLDLTTNDVGCYGGSNSRANFITPMGSAVVGFMQAPRVVAQGESVNIQAVGFDR